MGEAETRVQSTSIRGCDYEATARRNECRRSKAAVRDHEEAVGRTQKTVVLSFPALLTYFESPIRCGTPWNCASGSRRSSASIMELANNCHRAAAAPCLYHAAVVSRTPFVFPTSRRHLEDRMSCAPTQDRGGRHEPSFSSHRRSR